MRDIPTVRAAPLVSIKQLKAYDLINPIVEIGEQQMAVRLEQLAGNPTALLGDRVSSIAAAQDRISIALHRLMLYVGRTGGLRLLVDPRNRHYIPGSCL